MPSYITGISFVTEIKELKLKLFIVGGNNEECNGRKWSSIWSSSVSLDLYMFTFRTSSSTCFSRKKRIQHAINHDSDLSRHVAIVIQDYILFCLYHDIRFVKCRKIMFKEMWKILYEESGLSVILFLSLHLINGMWKIMFKESGLNLNLLLSWHQICEIQKNNVSRVRAICYFAVIIIFNLWNTEDDI